MARRNDWKKRAGIVYSTDSHFQYTFNQEKMDETLPPVEQRLTIRLDKRNRAGKNVTLIQGFVAKDEDIRDLAQELKTRCGCGGSFKRGEIIIQGDFRNKVSEILKGIGYPVRTIR